jgi:hypothetical protein
VSEGSKQPVNRERDTGRGQGKSCERTKIKKGNNLKNVIFK